MLDLGTTFDANGNVAGVADYTSGARQAKAMVYDGLDRLASATSPMFGTASYSYDTLDNLKTVVAPGRTHTYNYNTDNNRLLSVTDTVTGNSVIGMNYDLQGNLFKKNGIEFIFDYGNRLRTNAGLTYRYDADGRRVRQDAAGLNLKYSYYARDGRLVWQRDEPASKRISNLYLAGSMVAEYTRPIGSNTVTVSYLHTDALGSPIAKTNAAKTVIETSEYEPYGKLLNRANDDRAGYAGHVMDSASGLIYMQQRYYDSAIGRFLSVDPVTAYSNGDMRHFNRYAYAFNNPYKFTDPDGRDGELFWTAPDQVTVTFKYVMTGVSASFTPAQMDAQVAKNYSGNVTVNGVNVTVKAQAVQVTAPGKGVNTINVVKDTAGVTKSGRSETNAVGGNKITLGATGVDAATKETGSHEVGHGLGAGDQYKGGIDVSGKSLPADVPGAANVMKDLSGAGANSQTLGEIIKAPTNVNTCAKGVSAASGGC